MPIVIKEIIVRTTVEKPVREVPVDEALVRKIERRILTRLQEDKDTSGTNRIKDR